MTTEIQDISILVVEDEKPLQKAIRAKLEREGFGVVSAVDVDQALEYVKDEDIQIDGVWLDHYLLGKKNGLDFVGAIQGDEKLKNVPVFVVTNTAGYEKKKLTCHWVQQNIM